MVDYIHQKRIYAPPEIHENLFVHFGDFTFEICAPAVHHVMRARGKDSVHMKFSF